MKIEAVCLDMDGTLIRNTDSVRYLCTLNKSSEELEKIECREDNKSISWIEADYLKAALISGLDLAEVEDRFIRDVRLIKNIDQVLQYLRGRRMKSVLITAGPIQVANVLGREFDFDAVYGSQYELKNHEFTGRITGHLGNDGKLNCLKNFCAKYSIGLDHCVAIGDSESDILIFRKCGKSIAINYTDALKGEASAYIITDDLSDIIDILKSWLAE
jgi:phosphoserine phosphatase